MSRWLRISLAAVLAVGLVALATGCNKDSLGDVDEGQSFSMGELRWNVLFDRELNPAQVEDKGYLTGQPAPAADQEYFAVFVLVKNQGGDPVDLPARTDFTISDTTGAKYQPLESSSDFNFPYGSSLASDDQIPTPDSVAASGPTQGSMLLFLLNTSVSENRPLDLEIDSQGEKATVALDL